MKNGLRLHLDCALTLFFVLGSLNSKAITRVIIIKAKLNPYLFLLNCTQAEVLAIGSLTQSSSSSFPAPVYCFLLCEPSMLGRALLASLNVSVVYAATREDFAPALMIRDSRRHVDPRAFARCGTPSIRGWTLSQRLRESCLLLKLHATSV